MAIYKQKRCENCGIEYIPTGGAQKYCESCAAEIDREKKRLYAEKKRKEDPDYFKRKYAEFRARQKESQKVGKPKPDKANLCNEKICRTCKYGNKHTSTVTCDYLVITGHRRGCPAGSCDKYEKGKGRRKK